MPDDVLAELGTQFTTEEAAEKDSSLKVGDVYEEQVENVGFGRIAAQIAKQVIVQKVRDAERAQVVDEYRSRVGELLAGTVKKVTRDHIHCRPGQQRRGPAAPRRAGWPGDVPRQRSRARTADGDSAKKIAARSCYSAVPVTKC